MGGEIQSKGALLMSQVSSEMLDAFYILLRICRGLWGYGQSELKVKRLDYLNLISVSITVLTPRQLKVVLSVEASLSNGTPIKINNSPEANGLFRILAPVCFILSRSQHKLPDDTKLALYLNRLEMHWCGQCSKSPLSSGPGGVKK